MWRLGGVWVVLEWCLGGDSNWLASFKDVAGGLRLLHGFYFGGGVVISLYSYLLIFILKYFL